MRVRTDGRVGGAWMSVFGLAWLAIWAVQLAPVQLLLPLQLNTPDDANGWIGGVVSTGIVLGIGGLAGVIAAPLAGAMSDRSRTRLGRRRPWAIGGAALAALCLVLTGIASGPIQIGLGWTGVSVGIAVASAAFTALIADQLPETQRGGASSIASSAQALGIVVGVAAIILLGLSTLVSYLVLACAIAVIGIGAALLLPDPLPSEAAPRATSHLAGALTSLTDRDFGWMLAGRLVVNIGNALPTAMMLFILMYGLGQGASAEDNVLVAILVYTVFVVAASFLSGWYSDRTKRRRTLTVVGAVIQALAALTLLIYPSWETLLVGAALIGTGYGIFMTVGLAFATDLLPDRTNNARDLGLVNVTAALGQLIGPLIGAALVAAVGGFWLLYLASGVFSLVGGLMNLLARERTGAVEPAPVAVAASR